MVIWYRTKTNIYVQAQSDHNAAGNFKIPHAMQKKNIYVPVSNVLEERVQKKQKIERFQKSINILTHCIRKFDVSVENYET
jgi:hypothetical protein